MGIKTGLSTALWENPPSGTPREGGWAPAPGIFFRKNREKREKRGAKGGRRGAFIHSIPLNSQAVDSQPVEIPLRPP